MAEYIGREALFRSIADDVAPFNVAMVFRHIHNAPAADVVPVVHGRWVTPHWHNRDYCYNCSKCGGEAMHREYQWARNGIYPICPNCGARMDGGEDHAVS